MMKKWGSKNLLRALFTSSLLLMSGSLSAAEDRPEINTRPLSLEEREEYFQNSVLEEENHQVEADFEEELSGSTDGRIAKTIAEIQNIDVLIKVVYDIYYTGETVTLNDGSIWTVKPSDRGVVRTWRSICKPKGYYPANVYITQNNVLFRSMSQGYDYKLVDAATGKSIRVKLAVNALYEYVHQITSIDYKARIVYLHDGLTFRVTTYDDSTLSHWQPLDYALLGVNGRWNNWTKPYMIINTNRLNHVRAKLQY